MTTYKNLFPGAVAAMMIAAPVGSASAFNLIDNGDIERISRFDDHGVPGVDSPNGFPDAWHHSTNATWSNGTTDPVTSGTHSLMIVDDNAGGVADISEEFRSFSAAIPNVGEEGRALDVSWNWYWDITSEVGDRFSATVRISDAPVVGLDLVGNIVDHVFTTDGSANSNGFQHFMTSIPLSETDASFDIIFKTEDRVGPASETGTFFIDDVVVTPEPASLALLGLGGLAVLGRRRG